MRFPARCLLQSQGGYARYIDEQGQIVFSDNVGRCDHEQSCDYHYSPSDYFKNNPDANCNDDWRYKTPIKECSKEKPLPTFIDSKLVKQTLHGYSVNPLYRYISTVFGKEETERLFALYKVGTSKDLWDVRDKLNDKKMKLAQAKLQLDELQKNTSHIEARNREIKADFEKTAVSYQQQMINKIWAQAGMKALAEIADIYPRMTSIHDSSLFDDSFAMDFINYGYKIIYCAMYLYVGYINEATNFAESQGGGGSDTKDWGREKDEDEIEWIRRCLQQATRMVKPRKGKWLSR